MRILVMANNDVGLYKFRKELLAALLEKGHEVYISLPSGELVKPLEEMGCRFVDTPIDRRGINPVTDLKLFFRYLGMIRRVKPDQIITYTIKPNIYGALAARMLRVPYAVNITGLGTAFQHDGLLQKMVICLYKVSMKAAHVSYYENAENRDVFVQKGIVPEERTCLLHGAGVNLEEYRFVDYPAEKQVTRLLFMGRVMKEKGIDELMDAVAQLKREQLPVHLDVIGPCEEEAYKQRLNTLQQEGVLTYHGYQKDVKPFIQRAHCFVLPSYHEGMANTLLESAAMGRPLITSDIHGCKEAVDGDRNGLLCQPGNTEELTEKIRTFVSYPYEKKAEMGRASRAHMEAVFDKKKVVAETLSRLPLQP